jgi:hypothetical protein
MVEKEMIAFLVAHWLAIVIIGIVANFAALMQAASERPEGAMGMQVALLFCFVPYLIAGFWLVDKVFKL